MKLRNIFTMLAAALAFAFVGCQEEERFLEEVQVDKSFLAIPVTGGTVEVNIDAAADWAFAEVKDVWPNVVERDTNDVITSSVPSWLSVDKMSGPAGKDVVKFTAAETSETRELVLSLVCDGVTQIITVLQMAEKVELPFTDCATVLKEKEVGKVYKVKGTVTDLTNYDKYGCFYVNDGTGEVYVYGSMNPKQFAPEVGDIIAFEGPWTSYGNFDDVTILSLEKSLIKLETLLPAEPLSLEGGKVTALLTVKEGDLVVEIPEDATWLTAGEPGNIGGMTSVELTASANDGGARKTTVTFKVTVDEKDYIAMADIEQEGAIAEVSVKDFLAAEEGTALYQLTGVVKNIANTTYGNFDLVDATGSVYVYGLTGNETVGSNDKSFESLGIKEGDVITIVGTRASYKETPQVGGTAYLLSHDVAATESTVADFLAKPVGDAWYKLTGTVSNISGPEYGNFDLVGEDGSSVYVYGLTTSFVAKNDKSFANIGLKEGDVVTLVGKRAEYKGTAQVGGPAYYISHEAAAAGEPDAPENPSEGDTFASNVTFGTVSSAYTDGVATVNGTENVATLKLGTSKLYGEGTITVPAGVKTVTYYAVAWKGNPSKLEFSVNGSAVATQEIAANDGATSVSPYTITVADADKYTLTLSAATTAETVITVKTVETGYRAILFGVNAK